MKAINGVFIFMIKIYQLLISPIIGQNCRYYPTCSSYCIQSFQKYNTFKAIYLAIKRILKCNPLGGSGHDPVP